MKRILLLSLFGAGCLLFGACQNHPPQSQANFTEKTHRSYNPETGSWEQSPPFGKESNKSTSDIGQ